MGVNPERENTNELILWDGFVVQIFEDCVY